MPKFEDIFSVLKNDRKLTQEELIRAIRFSIAAEYEAIQLYDQLAESIDDNFAIEVLNHVSEEEKVHVGEFLKLLEGLDPQETSYYNEGKQEIEELKFSSTHEALQYLSDYTQKSLKIAASMEKTFGIDGNEIYFYINDYITKFPQRLENIESGINKVTAEAKDILHEFDNDNYVVNYNDIENATFISIGDKKLILGVDAVQIKIKAENDEELEKLQEEATKIFEEENYKEIQLD